MDIGCYPIFTSRFIFGEEPTRVIGLIEFDPRFKSTGSRRRFWISLGPGDLHVLDATRAVPARADLSARRDGSKSKSRSTRRPIGRRASG